MTAFTYSEDIRKTVWNFKYRGQIHLARFFARQMAYAWNHHSGYAKPDVIVPVPIHWTRRLSRGYNQSDILAGWLSKLLGLPMMTALKRIRSTGHQAEKNARQRHMNIRGAFAVVRPEDIQGREILLLDDVLTTGSTLNEAATTLKKSGAADISVITIARDL